MSDTPTPPTTEPSFPPSGLEQVISRLEGDLSELQEKNHRSLRIGILLFALVATYLFWAGSQFKQVMDPEGLAWAVSGMAMEAVPAASETLHEALVDGAPDIARVGGQAVVEMVPTYREVLLDEIAPIIEEISVILANTAVTAMLRLDAEGMNSDVATQVARETATAEVIERLDTLLEEAMDESGEEGEPSPREAIVNTMDQLEIISRGLDRIAGNQGDDAERELLIAWMNVVGQFGEDLNASAEEAYRAGERIE